MTFNATNVIDYSSPYPFVFDNVLEDQPGNLVARNALDYFRSDYFSDYVMFEPTNGIPVPVAQFDWGWDAEVSYVKGSGLTLVYGNPYYSGVTDILSYPPEFTINEPDSVTGNQSWTKEQASILKRLGIGKQ